MLASPLYMMQIYNRVLPSRSESTLIVLTGLAAAMLGVMCLLELIRSRILVRVFRTARGHAQQDRDDGGRQGLRRPGPRKRPGAARLRHRAAVLVRRCDLHPVRCAWMPVTIAAVFVLHPLLGGIAALGAVALFALGVLDEVATRGPLETANRQSICFNGLVEGALRNAEVLFQISATLKSVRGA